jgi:uncharacterized protein YqjF (DUF2071 family)
VPVELLAAPARQAASTQELAHRPWPLPERRWVLGQTWEHLLFAHYRVDGDALRALLPAGLELEERDGSAWLGVTPFLLSGVRARGTLPLPRLSSFRELNVRTYVTDGERPGIWFLSLDASSRLAVETARRAYRLPYFHARMTLEERGGGRDCSCARRGGPRPHVFSGSYRPAGPVSPAAPGSLEWFLTERYCLYATGADGALHRAEIHHGPWPLQQAEARIELNTMPPDGVELGREEPLCHYSARQDVVLWPLEPLAA